VPDNLGRVEQLVVQLGSRSYPITIGPGALEDRALLASQIKARQLLVVTNEVVAPLYLEKLLAKLPRESASLVLPDGERHKTLATFERIIERLIELKFHRDACLVALGGGVIGDVAGFAAACYQRGIDFVQAPTTLLAQVDSSVGGKTAVNHRLAKNMIGAFHQPVAVISDTKTLQTLPPREFSAGLAEVIKHGLILDRAFFGWLEERMDDLLALDDEALAHAIRRCCEIKASIVAEDEFERGRRALLNLGHTFGHALEAVGEYGQWLHGEAVAVGISIAARTSSRLGTLPRADCERIDALLLRARLPVAAANVDVDRVLSLMQLDKKAEHGGLKLVLLSGIGEANLKTAPDEAFLRQVLAEKLAS
jgi:3-dehydroquinate synthase